MGSEIMTYTIDLSEVPVWVWIVAGTIIWYAGVGLVMRLWNITASNESVPFYLTSPVAVPVLGCFFLLWAMLWLVSFGWLTPPWED